MTNANSFHSALIALGLFAAIYFVALGIYEVKKLIEKAVKKNSGNKKS